MLLNEKVVINNIPIVNVTKGLICKLIVNERVKRSTKAMSSKSFFRCLMAVPERVVLYFIFTIIYLKEFL